LIFVAFTAIIGYGIASFRNQFEGWNMTTTLATNTPFDDLISHVIADRSFGTAAKYEERLRHFVTWLSTANLPLNDKRTIAAYKKALAADGKSASTVNGHLVAVRALLRETGELGLLDQRAVERAASVKGVREKGTRAGNWLSMAEAQALLDLPDPRTLKGKRDRAVLAVLLFCGLRRSELASLTLKHLQTREGHHIIADLIGKGGRVRTIKLPVMVWRAINEWLQTSQRDLNPESLVFVAMRKGDYLAEGETVSAQALYKLVKGYGAQIGHPELAPHDLRRTFAKLAKKGNAALEDISMTLGHASLQTTQRYLGLDLNLDSAAPDRVGLHLTAR
jgi:site-specific recombinase XerD